MLRKRLISCLVLQDQLLVQSHGFKTFLPIGRPDIAVEFMTNWDIDEIILLDITATKESRKPNLNLISTVSKNCFVPLTFGGGISTLQDVYDVIRAGGDKVSINTSALKNPNFITEIAKDFGTQCVVVAMDVKTNSKGQPEVVTCSGSEFTGRRPLDWALECEAKGAGEILIQSVDRDGSKNGYDLPLLKTVTSRLKIPVIALGGVGVMKHFAEGITEANVSAVAAANIFQHVEHSTIMAKSFLKSSGIDIRLSTFAKYTGFVFDSSGRILKQDDSTLDQMWLEKFKLESI